MSTLILWKDRQINKIKRDIDRLFDLSWCDLGADFLLCEVSGGFSVNITETENAIIIQAKLEDVDPESLDVSVTDDILIIKGEKKKETVENSDYYRRIKKNFSTFSRTVKLPCRIVVEDIEATYKNGVLKIILRKWVPETLHRIKIRVS